MCKFCHHADALQQIAFCVLCVNEIDWKHINIDSLLPAIKITYNVERLAESKW